MTTAMLESVTARLREERDVVALALAHPDSVAVAIERIGDDAVCFADAAVGALWSVAVEAHHGKRALADAELKAAVADLHDGPATLADVLGLRDKLKAVPAPARSMARRSDHLRKLALAEDAPKPGDIRPVVVTVADVKAEAVQWLWPSRFAIGKIGLLAGDPGLGKSTVSLDLAARVSRGVPWPDGTGNAPHGDVLLLSAEDGVADTIRPRLDSANADVARVHVLKAQAVTGEKGTRELAVTLADVALIDDAVASLPGCKLVVIDPLGAFMGKADSHVDAEVRGLLAPLAEIADKRRVAVVIVAHLNKANAGKALYRVGGSIGISGAARSAWLVTEDQSDPDKRLMLSLKNNLARDPGGLAFRLRADGDAAPHIEWIQGAVNIDATTALAPLPAEHDAPALDDAVAFLRAELESGDVPADEMLRRAKAAGVKERTLRQAKADVGVHSVRREGVWYWTLKAASTPLTQNPLQPCSLTETPPPERVSGQADSKAARLQPCKDAPRQTVTTPASDRRWIPAKDWWEGSMVEAG